MQLHCITSMRLHCITSIQLHCIALEVCGDPSSSADTAAVRLGISAAVVLTHRCHHVVRDGDDDDYDVDVANDGDGVAYATKLLMMLMTPPL